MGGLTKEWFLLLIRQIFHPDYGMFVYHPHSRSYWFSTDQEGNLREYNLIGVLMGLAVYNSIILDLHFPSICYRKLLSPPVVPPVDTSNVGIVHMPTIDDLAEIMPVRFFIQVWFQTFLSISKSLAKSKYNIPLNTLCPNPQKSSQQIENFIKQLFPCSITTVLDYRNALYSGDFKGSMRNSLTGT